MDEKAQNYYSQMCKEEMKLFKNAQPRTVLACYYIMKLM
jgi:hypothetical protein